MRVPDWWVLVLLALAAYRLTRLAGWDTITAGVRGRLTLPDAVYDHWHEPITSEIEAGRDPFAEDDFGDPAPFPHWRWKLAELVRCPWCAGWWICGGVFAAWSVAPRATLWLAAWPAMSTLVGLAAKHLDR